MCHNHSTALPKRPSVIRRSVVTEGTERVPYLIFHADEREDGDGPESPWVTLVTDIFGVSPFYEHLADLLASEGYRVAVPDLFHRVGPPRDSGREAALDRRKLLDDRQAFADLATVIDAVVKPTASPEQPAPFGVVGFCLGGTLAILLAAEHPNQATLTWYAFPREAPGARVTVERPIDVAPQISGPLLGFWGREDYIDSAEVDELEAALAASRSQHEVAWYDDVGHSFLSGLTQDGPNAAAAADSWRRGLDFLHRSLTTGATVEAGGRG